MTLKFFFETFGPAAVRRRNRPPAYAVPPTRRAAVIERDGSRCVYCGRTLLPAEVTLDHVVPRAHRGGNAEENLRVACRPCNSSKGTRPAPHPRIASR